MVARFIDVATDGLHLNVERGFMRLSQEGETVSKESVEAHIRKIEAALPPSGKVSILQFTDKQYENIITFRSRSRDANGKKPPPQLELF